MNFSIVLPSRGDFAPVKKMLDSFERTTKYKDKLEFLFAIDEGKTDIIDLVNKEQYSFKIRFFERPKTDDFTNDYYNFLTNKSVGNNVLGFNDDAWMRTQDWDEKVLRHIADYGWETYYCEIKDSAQIRYGNKFPCFPMASRKAINTLGFLLIPEVRMYPADKLIFEIYEYIGRIIKVPDVLIEHDHIPENAGTKDRMMRIFNEDKERFKTQKLDPSAYINKLLLVCCREKNKKNKLQRIINILKEK